ncbi:MAG: ATP-dependent DNA helicase UvrD2 [Ilumatobacteraceae bacterium]
MPVPGPPELGRGVVLVSGTPVPPPWLDAPVVTIDEAVLADPAPTVARLHAAWAAREPLAIVLGVDPAVFRQPASITVEPWRLAPGTEPSLDRLHFLTWANTYDARVGEPVWWWGVKAARLDDAAAVTPDGEADIVLPDGRPAWVDGGPRSPLALPQTVVHSESVDLGRLTAVPPAVVPSADLAPDQLAAVSHGAGPARVIAPAGSGKTRVLTERLRHLHVDRAYEPAAVLAVAYNKQAQLEMEARTTDFRPRVRTLNSLGLWVVAEHRGASPPVLDEPDVRRIIDDLLPGRRQRRANTDPIGPYVEGLTAIRLGLTDPEVVEASRDDVPGLAELFPVFRRRLAERRAVDFDEQIYAAVEALLSDGAFRRSMQRSCAHLLVDEFQDLTPAHVLLLRLLSMPALDVFGVGDDDQCIYGHAGADPAFLIDYGQLFPGAVPHPLTVNYRCPVEVVSGARTLLGYNHRRVAKAIEPGPAADATPGALRVVEHGRDDGATATLGVLRQWLAEPGVDPASIAVLARVNSLLLAPHVALHVAGLPISSVLRPDVLERTGMRAALAYLRIAVSSDGLATRDVVEILRRPTRGLPPWFSERLDRRSRWTLTQLVAIADQVGDKDAGKVLRLVDDLRIVVDAGRDGTTRHVLEAVRDDVGLGAAMSLLDRTGGGQGSSHLDDLDGLLGVADLHPEPEGFEPWLRDAFRRESDAAGITLSTIHRVKGREWDRIVVFGAADGIMPHRLADDVEEERRVLHVAITRARHRVAVMADGTRRSGFLDELAGRAPPTLPPRARSTAAPPVASAKRPSTTPSPADGIAAAPGLVITIPGGHEGTVEDADGRSALVRTASGGTLRVRYGERVGCDGRRAPLVAPAQLWGDAAAAEAALRSWRTQRAAADAVPAYVVVNDKHLRGIALARPTTPADLVACDGIGPAKLERYGDEILGVIDALAVDRPVV